MKHIILLFASLIFGLILPAQNVGINTSSPKAPLHVNGDYYGLGHIWLHAFEGDGNSGTAYLQGRDDSGTTSIGLQFRTQENGSTTDVLYLDPNGRVGIKNNSPGYPLQIDGVTGGFDDGGIRLENASASTGWSFYPSSSGVLFLGKTTNLGNFNATSGAYTATSDARLKTNIRPLESVLPNLMALEMKRYEFIHNNPDQQEFIGLLAQDLYAHYPEFVSVNTANDGNPLVDNQMGVDYAGLSILAIKAIQEQQATIEALQARLQPREEAPASDQADQGALIEAQAAEIDALSAQVQSLEDRLTALEVLLSED